MTANREREKSNPKQTERLRRRLGEPDPRQIAIWRAMSGERRLELVGQAYHLALETIRASERSLNPGVSPEELDRRVIRRMHGDVLPRDR